MIDKHSTRNPTALRVLILLTLVVQASDDLRGADKVLAGTTPLTLKQPLDEVMVDGINRFCLRELKGSAEQRQTHWSQDYSNAEAYAESIAGNRKRLRATIGAVDERVTDRRRHRFGFELLATLKKSSIVARTDNVAVHRVRWQVLDGVTAEGLLLKPKVIRACVVAIPDADWTPEMFCGVVDGIPERVQFVRKLVEAGCLVAIPTLISRSDQFSGHPSVGYTNLTHREFVYRQAFEMGRHVIGYEVQKILAAVDLFEQASFSRRRLPIGVAGVGEGGLLALYAAAIDPRIDVTLVSGYFQKREEIWKEPIYRNVWGLLTEFGDAELAAMIAPRKLIIEACQSPEIPEAPAHAKRVCSERFSALSAPRSINLWLRFATDAKTALLRDASRQPRWQQSKLSLIEPS